MRANKSLLTLLLLIGLTTFLSAHPHMMLTSRCTVRWEGEQLSGIQLDWEFDKFFSADIIGSFDLDNNRVFDEEETGEIYQYAFSNLENYHYFVFFREGDRRFFADEIRDFSASCRDGILTYSFFIPLERFSGREIHIAVYDYSFFCQVRYDKDEPVLLDYRQDLVRPEFSTGENKDYPVYYDPYAPASDLTIHEKWFPGLETFYPVEISVVF